MASETPPVTPENAADPPPHHPQDMQAMRRKLERFGIMMLKVRACDGVLHERG